MSNNDHDIKPQTGKAESSERKDEENKKLNTPSYDVMVDDDGNVINMVSEEVLDNINIPQDVFETLCEALSDLRQAYGLEPGEEFPEGVVEDFIYTLLETGGIDITNIYPDPEPENPADNFLEEPAEECNFTDDARIIFTEDDLELLKPDEDTGLLIFETFQIEPPEVEFENWLALLIEIHGNKLAEENSVHVRIVIPYIRKISYEGFDDQVFNSFIESEAACIVLNNAIYTLDAGTYAEYNKILNYCGRGNDPALNTDNPNNLIKSLADAMNVDRYEKRPNGFYDDYREYWYDGTPYYEGDVVWIGMPSTKSAYGMKGFIANIDNYSSLYVPCDVTNVMNVRVENHRRVPSKEEMYELAVSGRSAEFYTRLTVNEKVWYLASTKAKTVNTPGYALVCLNGKFYVPVIGIVNKKLPEVDNLLMIFNVVPCRPTHHACYGVMIADIGNMQTCTGVRYFNGKHFDWHKRISQEIAAYKKYNPSFDPYDDPYDNPDDAEYYDE